MYWLTYVLLPALGGAVAVTDGALLRRRLAPEPARAWERRLGLAVLAAGVLNAFELLRMVGELDGLGFLVVACVLVGDCGVGLTLGVRRARVQRVLAARRSVLGWLALASAVSMTLVRGQILSLFG